MTLLEKQQLFTKLIAQLISYAYSQGYKMTFGEGYDDDGKGHMQGSLHYSRLAQDLNLFIDGKWIKDGSHPAWQELGQFWEKLDPLCAWGGRFSDSNHFSITHFGRK